MLLLPFLSTFLYNACTPYRLLFLLLSQWSTPEDRRIDTTLNVVSAPVGTFSFGCLLDDPRDEFLRRLAGAGLFPFAFALVAGLFWGLISKCLPGMVASFHILLLVLLFLCSGLSSFYCEWLAAARLNLPYPLAGHDFACVLNRLHPFRQGGCLAFFTPIPIFYVFKCILEWFHITLRLRCLGCSCASPLAAGPC